MGSLISLGIGNLEVDWGKNSFFRNHSALYLPSDKKNAVYFYDENVRELKPAFVRPLGSIRNRLELLGYTLARCRAHFEEIQEPYAELAPLTFDEFSEALRLVDVDRQGLPGDPEIGFDPGEYALETILTDPQFLKALGSTKLQGYRGLFFENLDPYVILRLLAENQDNLSKQVIWRYMDVVDGGWVDEEEIFEGLSEHQKFLLVTEGSSDSLIISQALRTMRPDTQDFFYFIDMSEGYPFTGTGNIVRFCQGLAKIRILNRIIVLLDNDSAGNVAYSRLKGLDLPRNMAATLLPDVPEFERFRTLGPSGERFESVARRAVSIELFLDLKYLVSEEATIRWTSFDEAAGQYQGELINKESYARLFLKRGWHDRTYDTSKLDVLLKHVFSEAIGLTEGN